jgi:hypothetical protein
MEETPCGRLMLANLLHDFREQRLSGDAFNVLFAFIHSHWIPDRGWSAETVIEEVGDNAPESFLCQGPTCQARQCSRVMDSKSLLLNNLDYKRLSLVKADEIPEWLLDVLEAGIPAEAPRSDRLFSGKRGLVWVTPTEEIESVRTRSADPSNLAYNLRNLLGLNHYFLDSVLIEVQYPRDVVDVLRLSAPTVFDGGQSVIFRNQRTDDGWGRAVDLGSLEDGLPEAVHRPVPFTAQFRIRRIGRLAEPTAHKFNGPVEHAPTPWTGMPEDLEAFLKPYL